MNLATTLTILSGGPGSGRHKEGGENLYHGTTKSKAQLIQQNGLKLQKMEGQPVPHVTSDKSEALAYAKQIGSKNDPPAVVTLHPSASKFFDDGSTEYGKVGYRLSTRNRIPAQYIQNVDVQAGGPGSGCHGPNCGRPPSRLQMIRELKTRGIHVPRGLEDAKLATAYNNWKSNQKVRQAIEQKQNKLNQRAAKRLAKIKPSPKPLTHIPVGQVWKGNIKNQFVAGGGHVVMDLKAPSHYQKEGKTWLKKPSPYKGQFVEDLAEHRTYNDPKEFNYFFIHNKSEDAAVSIEVHRNIGQRQVNVIERQLGRHAAISTHREVTFKNIGTAMGFMNRRYGITFKLPPAGAAGA